MTIAATGERKTTLFNLLRKPIDKFCAKERTRLDRLHSFFEEKMSEWTDEKQTLRRKLSKARESEDKSFYDLIREQLREHELKKPKKPKGFKLVTQDATPQAIKQNLDEYFPTTSIIGSEGGVILDSLLFQDLPLLNSFFGGESIDVDRKNQKSVHIKEPLVTIVTAVQWELLSAYIEKKKELFQHSGFSARFLIAESPSNQGDRLFVDDSPRTPLTMYEQRLDLALNMLTIRDDAQELPAPYVIRYSRSAAPVFMNYAREVELELRPGGLYTDVRGAAGKSAEIASRISAILQFYEHGFSEIDISNAERGVQLARVYLDEQKRLFGTNHEQRQHEKDAEDLDTWLHHQAQLSGGHPLIAQNDILKFGPNRLRSSHRRDAALTVLRARGRVWWMMRNKKHYVRLNPAFYRVRVDPTLPPWGLGPMGMI
ncbi:hypothetical protein SRS16CHR_04799 [Variovorax sp. SRS16]|nr:hypothetical protein SRS16CHR_04799 [Variovorax sp. SRS16]